MEWFKVKSENSDLLIVNDYVNTMQLYKEKGRIKLIYIYIYRIILHIKFY